MTELKENDKIILCKDPSWQPEALINNEIRDKNNINTNWKYRKYLQENALDIMNYNSFENMYLTRTIGTKKNIDYSKTNPKLFKNINETNNNSYGNSDLKENYLKKERINSKLIAPYINYKQQYYNTFGFGSFI